MPPHHPSGFIEPGPQRPLARERIHGPPGLAARLRGWAEQTSETAPLQRTTLLCLVGVFAGASLTTTQLTRLTDMAPLAHVVPELIGWMAAAYCIWSLDDGKRASRGELALAIGLALLTCAPSALVFGCMTVAAAYMLTRNKSPALRACGAILVAIAAFRFWGAILFAITAPVLIKLDAAMTFLTFAPSSGIELHGTILQAPSGHAIEVLRGCSSFHNMSLAALYWVALTKIDHFEWRRSDWLIGLLAIAGMVAVNLFRLHEMALSLGLYEFWHDGPGKYLYSYGSAGLVLAIVLTGAHVASRRA